MPSNSGISDNRPPFHGKTIHQVSFAIRCLYSPGKSLSDTKISLSHKYCLSHLFFLVYTPHKLKPLACVTNISLALRMLFLSFCLSKFCVKNTTSKGNMITKSERRLHGDITLSCSNSSPFYKRSQELIYNASFSLVFLFYCHIAQCSFLSFLVVSSRNARFFNFYFSPCASIIVIK